MMRELDSAEIIGDGNDIIFNHPDGFSYTIHAGAYKVGTTLKADTFGISYVTPDNSHAVVMWGRKEPKLSENKEIKRETIEI